MKYSVAYVPPDLVTLEQVIQTNGPTWGAFGPVLFIIDTHVP